MFKELSDIDKTLLDTERFEIIGKNRDGLYKPLVLDEVTVTVPRAESPSSMEFTAMDAGEEDIQLGDQIRFRLDGKNFWYGYVFKIEYTKNETMKVKCYDQTRYLKFKDTIVYKDKTYSDLLKSICRDRGIVTGKITDTKYKIPGRVEEEKEYWEMLESAAKTTTAYTGEMFVLYDNAGKLSLQNVKELKLPRPVIHRKLLEDVSYTESIDDETYNRIKIDVKDKDSQKIVPVVAEDAKTIERWGVLQYYSQTTEPLAQVREKAKSLLKILNKSKRTIKLQGVFGIPECRGGSLIPVILDLRGVEINGYMLCESVKHTFKMGQHTMEIDAYNRDFLPQMDGLDKVFKNEDKEAGAIGGEAGGAAGTASVAGESSGGVGNGRARLLACARSHLGEKYSQARRNQRGYKDCSSLVKWSMIESGFAPKNFELNTRMVHGNRHFIPIARNQLRPGDVLWHQGHMALYVGGKTGKQTIESTVYPKNGVQYTQNANWYTHCFRIAGIDGKGLTR